MHPSMPSATAPFSGSWLQKTGSDPTRDFEQFQGFSSTGQGLFEEQSDKIEGSNTLYRVERWLTPDGKTISGKLPVDISESHFGPNLQAFILYQYYHAIVTQPLLLKQLHEFGVDISSGHLSHIITEGKVHGQILILIE